MEFFEPSPKALQFSDKSSTTLAKYRDNFANCPVGRTFVIPMAEYKLVTLRPQVSRIGKELGKKFKLIVHEGQQMYEIYRIM